MNLEIPYMISTSFEALDPQVVESHLTWFRKKDKENKGDVWVKDALNAQEYKWLKNVDTAPSFYNQKGINKISFFKMSKIIRGAPKITIGRPFFIK